MEPTTENQSLQFEPLPELHNPYNAKKKFKQLKRTDKVALYQVLHIPRAFEVFRVKICKPYMMNGVQFPSKEMYPSDEDFGKTAWSHSTLEAAEKKYEELLKKVEEDETAEV